jgi:hypothetical protein
MAKMLVRAAASVVVIAAVAVSLGAADWMAARPLGETAWRPHAAGGLSLEIPRSWQARHETSRGRTEIDGHQGERIVFVTLPPKAARAGASAALRSTASQLWPEAEWGAVERDATGSLRMRGRTQSLRGTCSLLWRDGTAVAALTLAPVGRARMAEARFAHALDTLRVTADAALRVAAAGVR